STHAEESYKLSGAQAHLELICETSVAVGSPLPALTLHRPGQPLEHLSPPPDDFADTDPTTARVIRMLAHFAECVRTGCAPRVRGMDARAALEILHAAYLSPREGTKVSLPLRRSPEGRALPRPAPPANPALPPPEE